jgi:hypothetical protein
MYIKDVEENGVLLKNLFVDINKKTDPFEYWNNNNNIKPFPGVTLNAGVFSGFNSLRRNF